MPRSRGPAADGADVVAIDRDEAVFDQAFRHERASPYRALQLVVDLADPTPPPRWRSAKHPSLLDRAAVGFDVVLCLAVLHHLIVGDGLLLAAVMDLLAALTRDALVAELVPNDDPWCRRLAAGRPVSAERWSMGALENEAVRGFAI